MQWLGTAALLLAALAWASPVAAAAKAEGPQTGIGIYLGGGTSNMHTTGVDQNTLGATLGADFQIALGRHLSINPIIERGSYAAGSISIFTIPTIVKWNFSVTGVQARLWWGDVYVGMHLARYTIKFSKDDLFGSTTTVESKRGTGTALGYESPGGVFLALQYDKVQTNTMRLTVPVIFLGARF